jgi:hypothetical protein
MPGHRAWDRLADEPPKAYALFLLYRSLGIGRTIKEIAAKIERSQQKVQVIANRYNWVFRADQWDAWALNYRSKAQEVRLMREAQVEARTVTDVLKMSRILARRALKGVKGNKAFALTPTGAAQLADLAVKLARLQRGEATSRSENVTRKVRDDLKEKLEQMAHDLNKEKA